MKTPLLYFLLLLTFLSCTNTDVYPFDSICIDESKIKNGPCYRLLAPVCGCDGETYGNDCEAGKAGVVSWVPGRCDTIQWH